MTKAIDLLCLGNPCADVVIHCDRAPAWDDKCVGTAAGFHAGGTESNVACAASRLGWRAAVLGSVGDDAYAAPLIDAFERDGVETCLLTRRANAASASTIVFVSPQGERAIVWVPMPHESLPAAPLDAALAASRIVYTMPYDADQVAVLHAAALRHGTEVAIDVEREAARRPGLLQRLLGHCDMAFMNASGWRAAIGQPPETAAMQALLASSRAHTIVVTLGADGAMAASRDAAARVAARPVEVVDTTGAGDSFNAAFLVARGRGMALDEALRFGCAAAGRTVGAVGARTALPSFAEVVALTCDDDKLVK